MTYVSITKPVKFEYQIEAARALSSRLDAEGFKHAFIGGFACAILGSLRPTQDIDVLLETGGRDVMALRERLVDLDPRFQIKFGIKFYFVRVR
ncbi:hypothetical protein C8Q80DRAFT_348 [Daedaleopsis nitida]|nr:hypothetical protein C8Q80DRAFT_348 [Daedaleopsis nitida]